MLCRAVGRLGTSRGAEDLCCPRRASWWSFLEATPSSCVKKYSINQVRLGSAQSMVGGRCLRVLSSTDTGQLYFGVSLVQFGKPCCLWFAYRASDSMEADSAVLSPLANCFCSLLPSCGSFHSQGHQADTEQAGPPGSPAAEGTGGEAGVRVSCRHRSRRGTINSTGNLVLTTHRREHSDVLHPLPTALPSPDCCTFASETILAKKTSACLSSTCFSSK